MSRERATTARDGRPAARRSVLVLDAEQRKSLAVVRALGDDFEVWTAAAERPAMAAWSRYAKGHLRYRFDGGFPAWLLDAAGRRGVELVVATQERTMIRCCEVYDDLVEAGVSPTFPRREILDRALDKGETVRLAREVGLPLPRTARPEAWDDALAAAAAVGYPVVVKPRRSHQWDGHRFVSTGGPRYARDPGELRRVVEELSPRLPPPLIQEFVPGEGYGVFLLLDRSGAPVAEFAHQRLRDVRPTGSGSVLRRSAPVDAELRELAVSLLQAMRWWGVAMVEFRRHAPSGRAWLMEVNGRFWGSLQLATDAGVNFPRLLVRATLGEPVETPAYRPDVHLRWWLGDLLRLLRVLRGRPRGYPGSFPRRGTALRQFFGPQPPGTRGEILRWGDPLPAAAEVLAAFRRLS